VTTRRLRRSKQSRRPDSNREPLDYKARISSARRFADGWPRRPGQSIGPADFRVVVPGCGHMLLSTRPEHVQREDPDRRRVRVPPARPDSQPLRRGPVRVKGRACSIVCDGEAALEACRAGPHVHDGVRGEPESPSDRWVGWSVRGTLAGSMCLLSAVCGR
jgi:hypothetical protein